jgi:peptidoglycan/LPS O-acetylase OafA/YrhL
MAFNIAQLASFAVRVRSWVWPLVVLVAAALLAYGGLVVGLNAQPLGRWIDMWIGLAGVGAMLLVFAAMHWGPLADLLQSRPIRSLGLISFSLYLVQDPVVVTLAELTGGDLSLWAMIPLGVGLSIVVGWVFFHMIERPAHRLSRSFLRDHERARMASMAEASHQTSDGAATS